MCRKIYGSLSSETRKCRNIRGPLSSPRRKCRKIRGSLSSETRKCRFRCQDYSSHISKKFKPWKKWLLQLKLLCGNSFFWPWAARGLSGSFEHVIDCCQDYNSHVSKKFEPWKKVAPAVKVIVWDCGFLALGGQRPFWEL